MKKYSLLLFLTTGISLFLFSYDKPPITAWNSAGKVNDFSTSSKKVSISDFGGTTATKNDNSGALQHAIKSFNGSPGIIEIPAGNFQFNKTISVPSNIIIKGQGSDKTILNFNLNGNSDLFSIQGSITTTSTPILSGTTKESKTIKVSNAANFAVGDFVLVKQSANHLLESNWAYNFFHQLVKITKINGIEIWFDQPLHLDFSINNNPTLQKILPVQNTGIESLKIKRNDASTGQTSNIFFNYAVNCHVKGVELENCNYAHITLQSSANSTVSGNYLHDAFDYGSGGKAYGVVLQFGACDNLIYDNIVRHLRHSFLLQAAANGNVIAYNYSYDPFWTQSWLPTGSAGDVVLHGNYPYANLIEGNIFQNLVIDNSHGINGPYNTFFRNRIEGYGIVMNGSSGDNMNFLANEITGSGLLKGLYTISGNQTEIANTIKGSLQSGTVAETSLISKNYSSKIGAPNTPGSWKNEAYIRNGKAVKTLVSQAKGEVKPSTETVKPKVVKKTKKKKKCKKK